MRTPNSRIPRAKLKATTAKEPIAAESSAPIAKKESRLVIRSLGPVASLNCGLAHRGRAQRARRAAGSSGYLRRHDKIAFNLGERTGNIWMTKVE